ncbi:MAG: hypothetical protein ACRDMJ_12120 [Solirubrobacteraceae bacterium]
MTPTDDPTPKPGRADARALGAQRLAGRRRRTALLRRRVLGLTVAGFVAVWGVLFVQLVSGHDPALAHAKVKAVSADAESAHGGDTDDSDRSDDGPTATSDASSTSSATATAAAPTTTTTPVTTAQS